MTLAKQRSGETAMLTLPARGTVEIGCDFHPMMTLMVTVE
jgi:plastocyanin